MSNTDTIVILIAFAAYLVLMIAIGAIYMKNTNNSEDYFLGGRGLSGWVAALSAQASDMSGRLFFRFHRCIILRFISLLIPIITSIFFHKSFLLFM